MEPIRVGELQGQRGHASPLMTAGQFLKDETKGTEMTEDTMTVQEDNSAAEASPPAAALPDLTATSAFLAAVGLVLEEVGGTKVAGHVELGLEHHTPWGVVHGGVYATIAETVASIGASAAVLDQGQFAVGVNNSTDFLRSVRSGRVDVIATPVFQGRVQQLWQVTMRRSEDGKDVARATVRLQNLPLNR